MPLKYTTQQAIAQRLAKRIQIGGTPQTYGKDVLDPALLEQVGPQVEARFEAALAQRYGVPLNVSDPNTRAIVASIVEKGILAEILPTQFFPENGREGGLRKVMADEAAAELKQVQSGQIKLAGERISGSALSFPAPPIKVSQRKPGAAENIQW